MKRRLISIFLAMLLCCTVLCQTRVFAEEQTTVVLNGKKLEFDQPAIIENGRTLVPLRKIFESLNAFVDWEEETQTVTAKKHGTEISLTIDSSIAKVNGEEYVLDVPAKIVNGRTLVPARFVAESLNCKVAWNGDANVVIIKSGGQVEDGDNLHNVDDVTYSAQMSLEGKILVNSTYNYSGFIKVTPGETLYFTNSRIPCPARLVTAYDADKNPIQESGAENVTEYTVKEGTEYVVLTTSNDHHTPYIKVSKNNGIDGFIADEICVASGRSITIYGKQLLSEKTEGFSFEWECEIGKADGANYTITASDMLIGEYPLTVKVTDASGNAVWAGNTMVRVVENTIKNMKLLTIGDSLTNNKAWLEKVNSRSKGKIKFVGTRGMPYKHEGRSGFTSAAYLNGTEYRFGKEDVQPFWNGERFDWNYFKEKTNIKPDAVQIFLGINGIQNNPSKNAANIVKMVDYIKNDDPDLPIFVINTMYKGHLSDDAEHLKVFNLMEKLTTSLSGYDNVFIVPVAITFDSENNYSSKDQIHPMDIGYEQIADVIYSSICANMK